MKKKYFVSTVRRLLVLLTVLLTGSHAIQADPVAQAVWCSGNSTLYFVYKEPITVGDTYDEQTVTQVWSGEAVTNTGTLAPNYPGWYTWNQDNNNAVWKNATTIKFDVSFVAVAPKSLFNWFFDFRKVTSITGLNYLDTSQATTMYQMFYGCSVLETIDVSHFDMGMVANVGGMFRECTALTTIYSNQTWSNIAFTNSDHMFTNSGKAPKKDGTDYGKEYAKPFTGFFTVKPDMAGDGTEGSPFVLSHVAHWNALADYVAAGNNCSGLYFKLGSDLKVTKRIGAEGNPFSGTFIGGYATTSPRYIPYVLSVDIDGGSDEFVAPFAYIQGAIIKDLSVTGSVKGGRHAAGLVGNIVSGSNTIINCRVATTVTTTDQYAGGVVGHGHSATVNVEGCLFEGTIKRESSGGRYAGAIMGWCDNNTNITILNCVEKGTYTNFSYTQLNYYHKSGGNGAPFSGTDCFSFHKWSVGKKAFEITLDDDDVLKPVTEAAVYRASSLIKYTGGAMSYLPEAEDDDDLLAFAAEGDTFSFELTAGTLNGVKDEDGNNVSYSGEGSEGNPYSFTMPAKNVTVSADEGRAYALLMSDNTKIRLVFAYSDASLTVGGSFESYGTIDKLWSGNAVKNTGWSDPGWLDADGTAPHYYDVTEVVFDESFTNVKPKSFFKWFWEFRKLATITGIEYLNTSEATNMNSMFYDCYSLGTINVNGFDVSKVTNATSMFKSCQELTTITCNNSWSIAVTDNMFLSCNKLRNTSADPDVTYLQYKVDGSMANPTTGYFTPGANPGVIPGKGTKNDPYCIGTLSQWNQFATNVNGGDNYAGKYVKLTADIGTINTMVGTAENAFAGEFDGDGHVLTVDINSEDLYAAPFRHVDGTIVNLSVSGTITTSQKHAGGIVGLATYLELRNCASDVKITSSVDGDGSHGGLVGLIRNPDYATIGFVYTVAGCRFGGKLLGANTTHCSGLVGYTEIKGVGLIIRNCLFAPAEVGVSTVGCETIVRYDGETTAGSFVGVSDCYYTAMLNSVAKGGTQVYEITDETKMAMPYNSTVYSVSGLTIGSNMLLLYTGSYKCYGAKGETVKFTCPVSVTAKKTDDEEETITLSGGGSDQSPFYFTMPDYGVTLTGTGAQVYAIWCGGESDKVLYFVKTEAAVTAGGTWNSKIITQVWSGDAVTKTGWGKPGWNIESVQNYATKVVFDSSFADVKLNSLYCWFYNFVNLTTIEGLQYLNTSEVTTMNSTFFNCGKLPAVDVSGFDMSKVTNTTAMFYSCADLVTIYCANSWDVATSVGMFNHCEKLVGAVKYKYNKADVAMANPYTGYFTKKYLVLEDADDNTTTITEKNGIANLEVTLHGRTFWKNNQWNTVCLPFDLNGETFISSPFVDAIAIKELDVTNKYKFEGGNWVVDKDGTDQTGFNTGTGVLTLFLKDVAFDDDTTDDKYTEYEGMKAGKPYLVKWPEDTDITDPVFPGVTIDAAERTVVTSQDTHVSFQGVYDRTLLTANDKSNRYLSGSTLYWPNANVYVNAFRNYFHLSPLAAVGVRSLRMESGDEGETTAIETISIDPTATANPAEATDNTYYNLNGQRVTTPTKGIYIHNGRKVIIK